MLLKAFYPFFFITQLIVLLIYFYYVPDNFFTLFALVFSFVCISIYLFYKINKNLFLLIILSCTFLLGYFLTDFTEYINTDSVRYNNYTSFLLNHYFYKYAYFTNDNYIVTLHKTYFASIISANFFFLGYTIINKKQTSFKKFENFSFQNLIILILIVIFIKILFNYFALYVSYYFFLTLLIYTKLNNKKLFTIFCIITFHLFLNFIFNEILSRTEIVLNLIFFLILLFTFFSQKKIAIIRRIIYLLTFIFFFLATIAYKDLYFKNDSSYFFLNEGDGIKLVNKFPIISLLERYNYSNHLKIYLAANNLNDQFLNLESEKYNIKNLKKIAESNEIMLKSISEEFYKKYIVNHHVEMQVNPGIIVSVISIFGLNWFYFGFLILGCIYGLLAKFIVNDKLHLYIFYLLFLKVFYLHDHIIGSLVVFFYSILIIFFLEKIILFSMKFKGKKHNNYN